MLLINIQICFVLDISYLYLCLYTVINISNLYIMSIFCCTLLTLICGILFLFIYIIICLLNDSLLNSVLIISLITCLFLACMLRFTSISSNIILYLVYSIFICNISLFTIQFGYLLENIYFLYLIFFTLSYCILYSILGVLRIILSLLIMVNLFLNVFIWILISHLYIDVLFVNEYIMLQGLINVVVLIISTDEFNHIYFVHSSFWIIICVLCCIYCTLLSIIYMSLYVCISIFVLIAMCLNITILNRVLSFLNTLLWSGIPLILISYLKLFCVIFVVLIYNIMGFVSCLIIVAISCIITSYLIMDNFISNIFSSIYVIILFDLCFFAFFGIGHGWAISTSSILRNSPRLSYIN